MKTVLLIATFLLLEACSDDVTEEIDISFADKYSEFPPLPVSSSQAVELMGAMSCWFGEGDGGCYGIVADGKQSVKLHSEADLCEPIEYNEGTSRVVKVCLLYTSPSPRDAHESRMPYSA